jgi:hypothetical protein
MSFTIGQTVVVVGNSVYAGRLAVIDTADGICPPADMTYIQLSAGPRRWVFTYNLRLHDNRISHIGGPYPWRALLWHDVDWTPTFFPTWDAASAALSPISQHPLTSNTPQQGERSAAMNGITEGNLITNGTTRATVTAATAAFIIATPEGGGDEFVLNTSQATSWTLVKPELVIERPFVVYRTDGTRVDGYKFESRALRNNKARCAGEGFWVAKLTPEMFTFVEA